MTLSIETMSLPSARRRTAPALFLPTPPTEEQKYAYLGREHRWIFPAATLAFAAIMISLTLFSLSRVALWAFLLPLALYTVTMAVSGATSFRRGSIRGPEHRATVENWVPSYLDSVDVFLPSAGEALAILDNTYRHVAALQWHGVLTVYVLDDSARPVVADLAAAYGFTYRTRPDPGVLKKAGNLRYGFDQSAGDVIAIFDADFVPRPDYLYELMPYFDDEKVAIVQSPQYFETPRDMHWIAKHAGSTQEMFYRWIQPSRDRFGAAICVGTCALYRRSALQQSGGFAPIGHSEDVHTGVNLMKAGFRVRYVPVNVSAGLCPDTFSAFVNQQYRWCSGSLSLLRNPTFQKHPAISSRQRVSFFAGFMYYISTAVNVLLMPLPPLIMLWVFTSEIKPSNSLWMIGSTLMWMLVYPLVHKSRWSLATLRVQYLYSWAHAVASVNHVAGRTKGWVATGAASKSTPISSSVRRVLLTHAVVTHIAIVTGLVHATGTVGLDQTWAMIALALVNAYVVLPAAWAAAVDPLSELAARVRVAWRALGDQVIDLTDSALAVPTAACPAVPVARRQNALVSSDEPERGHLPPTARPGRHRSLTRPAGTSPARSAARFRGRDLARLAHRRPGRAAAVAGHVDLPRSWELGGHLLVLASRIRVDGRSRQPGRELATLLCYAALACPDHAALIQRVLAVPTKRPVRRLVIFLTPSRWARSWTPPARHHARAL